jgi:DNA-binding transcriptional LysR family regulator
VQVDWLRAFVVTARQESMTLAASELFVDQSTVTRHVSHLQRATGLRLLRRTSSGVELTVDGRAFLPYATACLEAVEAAKANASALRAGIPAQPAAGREAAPLPGRHPSGRQCQRCPPESERWQLNAAGTAIRRGS